MELPIRYGVAEGDSRRVIGPVPADRRPLRAAPAASVINVASMYGIVASRGPMAAYNPPKPP